MYIYSRPAVSIYTIDIVTEIHCTDTALIEGKLLLSQKRVMVYFEQM